MRDILKSEKYFIKCINYEKNRINKFSHALENSDNNNVWGMGSAKSYLSNFNKNLFKLTYSAGEPIKEVFKHYREWVAYYCEVCTENDSLYDLIDMFAIGVLKREL